MLVLLGYSCRNETEVVTETPKERIFPEFTILEFYVAYKDYNWMMNFTEKLLEKVAMDLYGTTQVPVGEQLIDFKAPFKRVTMYQGCWKKCTMELSRKDWRTPVSRKCYFNGH